MPEPVHRRRINPIHATFQGAVNRRNGLVVVLVAPTELPVATRRPGAKAYGRDFKI
jgi:hypothetical protein